MSRCSQCGPAWGRTAIRSPRSVAQAFADHLNGVLNRTVTDARLTLLAHRGDGHRFTLGHWHQQGPQSFALNGSKLRLMVSQTIEVDGDKCHTADYAYRLASAEAKDAWLLRWEYFRVPPRPGYPYPLAHVHINAALTDPDVESLLDKPAAHMHIPTARTALELVLWHAITEWGVTPKHDDWQQVLEDSLYGFEVRRRVP